MNVELVFNIRKVRIQKRISMTKLARAAGISTTYLSNIENNLVENVGIVILSKIAFALDVPVTYLFVAYKK